MLPAPKVPPPAPAASALELVEAARTMGLATLAVPDVYHATPDGFEHHRVRVAIKHNALLCDLPDGWLAERPAHLLSAAEMRALYADLPDAPGPFPRCSSASEPGAVARTLDVAADCVFTPKLGQVFFPDVELATGESAYSRLCELAFAGACKRYRPLRPEVVRRLDYELSAIDGLGYAAYFLLVLRIADFARREGIPYVGRGSAADSLVSFCLELTEADPLRYRLPFERFLNPARRDRPDIDLDFCWRRRDEVLEHVYRAFGRERTAMIATINRFGLRSAFREAALIDGVPPVEVNRWSRRLPWLAPTSASSSEETGSDGAESFDREVATAPAPAGLSPRVGGGLGWDNNEEVGSGRKEGELALRPLPTELADNPIARSFAATPECRAFPFDDPRYLRILRAAAGLIDAPRHLGLHPGGVVVAPGPITDFVACQRAAKGCVMTQPDKDGVEALGLVKMDLLGNRALTTIDDCLGFLEERGIAVDLRAVSEEDLRTARLLESGRTLGCFQVESPGMRNLLKQTGAKSMDDVIQAVALIRPGPAGSGMKDAYVRRFRGREEPAAPHPRLTELLWDTHGVMLYQEDVMQVVVLMAGMDLAEADTLRRALAKRQSPELDRLRARYFAGAKREGIARAEAARVWELVANFASFGFCKAHAVTYGRIAYHAVYLKAHYPAAFLVSFLNSDTGYYETRVYVEEARRLGVAILPPDVNKSRAGFHLEEVDGRDAIRIGLDRVKGLSQSTLTAVIEERERAGAFVSLPDFLARTRAPRYANGGAHRDEVETLIQCGAFDAFDRTRPEMLWRLHLLLEPERRPPRDLHRRGEPPLDPSLLAACRGTPAIRDVESVRTAQARTGGWSQTGIGVGGLELGRADASTLFPAPETPTLALPRLPEMDAAARGRLELELLGLTVNAHPVELFPCAAEARAAKGPERPPRTIPCGELDRNRGRRVTLRGWLCASRRVRTSDGRWMRFLSLEDETGMAEAVLFPDVYERDGHRLTTRGPFLVSGVVVDQMGAVNLQVERLW
ncbi:MAG: DNA polymerase III subunit alpha [Planctomycetota bacterium]|nr:DNA polymerase III subunit alpha [Planctomycetota bacterium]